MYWEEKLDILKKKYPAPVFKDPFYNGPSIIEKIRNAFFVSAWKNKHEPSSLRIKNAVFIKRIISTYLQQELNLLEPATNYWIMLNSTPNGSDHQVYDCQKAPLLDLISILSYAITHGFYIADKKYKWIIYFNYEQETNTFALYKGENETPFG